MATLVETDDLRIIKLVHEIAEKHGVKVVTATGFYGRKIEMLEALRKELYAKYGETENRWRNRKIVNYAIKQFKGT